MMQCGTFVSYIYFFSFTVLVSMLIMNLSVAAVIEGLDTARKENMGIVEGDEIEKGRRVRGRLVTACNVRQSGSCVHVDTQSGGFRGDEAYLFFKLKQNAAQQKWNNSWSGCAVEDQSWVPVAFENFLVQNAVQKSLFRFGYLRVPKIASVI